MNEIKPGYKTTELWLAVLTAVIGLLVTYGIFSNEEAEAWQMLGAALIPLAMAIASAGYSASRAKVKRGD